MYVWIALILPKEFEVEVRDYMKGKMEENNINIDYWMWYLPQHITLKISFFSNHYI